MLIAFITGLPVYAQQPKKTDPIYNIDTTINYDELFSILDQFIDSLYTPHSFALVNMGISGNYYNFNSSTDTGVQAVKRTTFNPMIGYFHKSGLGVSVSASAININEHYAPYQYAISGSYDYLKNRKLATGIALTHYFTEDALPFYTSPLQNQVSSYITYRKWWVKPMVFVNYGWGSRTSYSEQKEFIKKLKLKKKKPIRDVTNTTTTTLEESINDLSATASLKHDFYWLNVLGKKDFIRLTPQLSFTGGTQKFGFNQVSNSYMSIGKTSTNTLYDSKEMYLDHTSRFQPLAVSAYLKTEFSIKGFFVQPQMMIDYYLPGMENNISTMFAVNTGFIF